LHIEDNNIESIKISALDIEALLSETMERITGQPIIEDKYREILKNVV
jgi:hypothetical protein